MKNLSLILVFCLTSIYTNHAQVGVGTTNPEAILDIRSSNQNTPANTDGILIPKINNFPTTNPTASQDGMMVYVTGSGTPTKGFYYWDQTITNWIAVNNNNSGWSKTGDTGTNSVTNFIGTTDTQDLTFKTNNVEKMRLTQKGQLEFFNTGESIFIGEGAGENDDLTNKNNAFVGQLSGNSNTSGALNSFFGSNSGNSNTTGNNNSFIGESSGFSNTIGAGNTFAGSSSGANNTSGFTNNFFGAISGQENTTGSSNSFFGTASGRDNTIGSLNSFFGNVTGRNNINGNANSFFGHSSGFGNTTGDFNSFFGTNSGASNNTGSNNSFFGKDSGANNTTGFENSFFGNSSGQNNGSGRFNSFFGFRSGTNNTVGNANVAIGFNSLVSNTTGDDNVAIGYEALSNHNDGNRNVAIGFQAGMGIGPSGFFKNNGVFIGFQAGRNENSSNRLYIESSASSQPLIYGEFNTNILGFNGDVAIGHQAPQAALHVEESGNANTQTIVAVLESDDSDRPILLFSESNVIDLNAGMSLEYNGVGSGDEKKMVFNSLGGNGLFEFQNGGDLSVLAGDIIIETTAGDREIRMGDNAGNNDRVMLRQDGTDHIFIGDIDNNGGNFTVRTGGVNAMTILSGSRNVGIGLTNPTFRLQLSTNSAAKPTSQLWTVVSDERLKKDIRSFTDGLETIKQINPVWFTYNGLAEMPNETGVGTLAQQLEEVAPYLIKDWEYKSEDGNTKNYKAVDYGPLTFIMVNAIKEQATTIEQLTRKLEVQQTQNEERLRRLEERLSNLEN